MHSRYSQLRVAHDVDEEAHAGDLRVADELHLFAAEPVLRLWRFRERERVRESERHRETQRDGETRETERRRHSGRHGCYARPPPLVLRPPPLLGLLAAVPFWRSTCARSPAPPRSGPASWERPGPHLGESPVTPHHPLHYQPLGVFGETVVELRATSGERLQNDRLTNPDCRGRRR